MHQKMLINSRFHALLVVIDNYLAEEVRKQFCPSCGGALHKADYPRSPLGLPPNCRDNYEQRRSFCCGKCRKRITTPSVRFFGRYRFPAPVVVLLSLLKGGVTKLKLTQVRRYLGVTVSKRTWKRWRCWWRDCFIKSKFWMLVKGKLPTQCIDGTGSNPRVFLLAYAGVFLEKLVAVLEFLAPMTAGIYRAV
jgi:hypothetical protein